MFVCLFYFSSSHKTFFCVFKVFYCTWWKEEEGEISPLLSSRIQKGHTVIMSDLNNDTVAMMMDATRMAEIIANMTAQISDLQSQVEEANTSIDLFFVLTMGIVCFMLQAGFGLLEVGSIRAKNAQNIMMKNMMDAVVTAVAYYLVGYSVAYGTYSGKSFCVCFWLLSWNLLKFLYFISLSKTYRCRREWIYWWFVTLGITCG